MMEQLELEAVFHQKDQIRGISSPTGNTTDLVIAWKLPQRVHGGFKQVHGCSIFDGLQSLFEFKQH